MIQLPKQVRLAKFQPYLKTSVFLTPEASFRYWVICALQLPVNRDVTS